MLTKHLHYTRPGGWSAPIPQGWDDERTVGLVFAAPSFMDDPAPLVALMQSAPQVHWIGCSTAGEISGAQIIDESAQVCLMRLERAEARVVALPIDRADRGFSTGVQLARALAAPSLRGVIVLSDGLRISGADLARGLTATLGESLPVAGGLAGDGVAMARTWVLADGQPREGYVAALGLYGESIHMCSSARGGWVPFGPTRRITRARHSTLYELDGKPALALYKEYLGDLAAELPSSGIRFPLAQSLDDGLTSLVRTVTAVDEIEQSITFTGDLYEGGTARLMRSTVERLVDGAQEAYEDIAQAMVLGRGSSVALAISCVGRRMAMGQRTEEELEGVSALAQGADAPLQIGFYSYGELSPGAAGRGGCALHNQTMTLTVIHEDAGD